MLVHKQSPSVFFLSLRLSSLLVNHLAVHESTTKTTHRIDNMDIEGMMRVCNTCGVIKTKDSIAMHACDGCGGTHYSLEPAPAPAAKPAARQKPVLVKSAEPPIKKKRGPKKRVKRGNEHLFRNRIVTDIRR